jgi:hypothetical protein
MVTMMGRGRGREERREGEREREVPGKRCTF